MIKNPDKPLTIGRIAARADVGIDTIRFYERRGLLPEPSRTESGYRLYPPATITRLNFIRRAKALGFSLDEIVTLLALQDTGGPKAEVKAITHRKLEQVEAKIADLERMRDVLRELDRDCTGTGDIDGCPIIEALSDATHENDAGPLADEIDANKEAAS
ncbi:MAG: MerR family DNA-binding protein [Gammaproteobacteria bacterium]|nr:MerR family DNA-binding protein [Gammaproteobacteria bacterium]